jgi:hypothetical protein
MSFNVLNAQMSSETTSLKIWLENSGSLTVPSTNTKTSTTNYVEHEFLSDELIWQVGFTISFSGGGTTGGLMTPWASGDGTANVTATLDSNFLYIIGSAVSGGPPTLAYSVSYYYRLLVP